jgi:hypothetical protein
VTSPTCYPVRVHSSKSHMTNPRIGTSAYTPCTSPALENCPRTRLRACVTLHEFTRTNVSCAGRTCESRIQVVLGSNCTLVHCGVRAIAGAVHERARAFAGHCVDCRRGQGVVRTRGTRSYAAWPERQLVFGPFRRPPVPAHTSGRRLLHRVSPLHGSRSPLHAALCQTQSTSSHAACLSTCRCTGPVCVDTATASPGTSSRKAAGGSQTFYRR